MKQSFALPILLAASTQASTIAVRADDCKDVHIFLARGNNEPYPGRQGKLVNAICNGLSSCDYEDIKFYNPGNSNYCNAVYEGATNGLAQITAYNQKCPDSKLVVSGYSQGADVVGDILGGGGGKIFGCTQKANTGFDAKSRPANKIAAALVFGDVRHTGNQAYGALDGASHDGVAPRTPEMLKNLNSYGAALRSYCAKGDPICAKGSTVADHLNYFDLYTDVAAEWVHERLRAVDSDSAESTSSKVKTTAKATATSTAKSGYATISIHHGSNSTITGSGPFYTNPEGSSATEAVTVPAYGHDSETITYKPEVMTTVVTKYATVTSDCPSKGAVYTEYKTVSVECPICEYVSKTATGHSEPSATGAEHTKPAGGYPSQPAWATQTNSKPSATGYHPGNNATASHYAPGPSSSAHSTPVPSVPVVGASAASMYLPQLTGVIFAIAAVLAF
ncbi:hypothetical protein G7Z17_g1984 [Cylindrodendrum hubeiense]|uniref:Cutinase n=1 Tax=Cylindrodendrum hubeiense TaxID=595255 RepID=A0A9P5HII5_9HYPO|nr:hypothetical protein G7Z17_g1984 [Cylindrodendrum hubeiense]